MQVESTVTGREPENTWKKPQSALDDLNQRHDRGEVIPEHLYRIAENVGKTVLEDSARVIPEDR